MVADTEMEDVAVAELRERLSDYLKRAAAGERFRVTEDGQPVATLGPLPPAGDTLTRLIAEGRAHPAKGDLLALGPPPPLKPEHITGISIGDALDEQRSERLP